jgi:hypothetical protein
MQHASAGTRRDGLPKLMPRTYPHAQIYCVFSPREPGDPFPRALLEKISMYLIGIGHNQSLPILCARASDQYVQLLIAVPPTVTSIQAMLLLEGEFLALAAQIPIRFHLAAQSRTSQAPRTHAWSGKTLRRQLGQRTRKLVSGIDPQSAWQC